MLRYWASATYFCQIVETILTGCILVIAFVAPQFGAHWLSRLEYLFKGLASRPRLTTIGIVVFIILARLSLLPWMPVPRPSIHDEFSYLLAAKTFAAGRLTNLPHPFWRHFESVHILQQPTYMSMYPPGQGLLLAAGILATGVAWSGVVVSAGLLGGALFWALSGWFPFPWAFAVTALASFRWLLVSYWMNSYWGGALPALGGALVFGAIPRLARNPILRDALAFGLGLVLLANTRPYEGLVLTSISLLALIAWSRKAGTFRDLRRPALLMPTLAMLGLAAIGDLAYNAHVSRDPLTLPYVQDRKEYAIAPLFIWERIRSEPHYSTPALRDVYVAEAGLYESSRAHLGIPELLRKLKNFWIFFLGPLLSLPFIGFWFALWRRDPSENERYKIRYIGAISAVMFAAVAQIVWFYPHYFAPAFAPFVATLLVGLREIRRWNWDGDRMGIFLSRAIPVGCLLMSALPAGAHSWGWRLNFWPLQWALGAPAEVQGPKVKSAVLAEGKKALVFVEYGKQHDPGFEWIYNDPDIQNEPIIWARRVSSTSDAALIDSVPDRNIWILRPDDHPATLVRLYPPTLRSQKVDLGSIW